MIREDLRKIKRMLEEIQILDWTMKIGRYICPSQKGQCLKERCPCYHPDRCAMVEVMEAVKKRVKEKTFNGKS